MKFASILLTLALACRSALAHPLDLPFEASQEDEVEKRTSYIAVTGVPGATHTRYEVRELLNKQPNQWTLFILAMAQFQAQSTSSATSYYQIAGIHGVPRQSWNGVPQCGSCGGADGYCPHDMIIFPAWHRVYVALFEQEFVAVAQSIANSWPTSGASTTRSQMQAAANTLRLPYWDWAAHPPSGLNTLPTVMTEEYITVNGPKGQESLTNPLFRYSFQSPAPNNLVYSPFVEWGVTHRYPTNDANTAGSQNNEATSAFNNIRSSLQDQVYQLFTQCTSYQGFSNDNTGGCSSSLEGIHNTVHTTSGGPGTSSVPTGGHMTYLSLASFDPMFWLHHANVDRYFAMWQALHSGSYSATQNAPHNTWSIASGTGLNMDYPLQPFTKDTSGDFWTSNEVRSMSTFNYNYPEFADSDGSQSAIASYVNKLYGPSATATAGSTKRTEIPNPMAAAAGSVASAVPSSGPIPIPSPHFNVTHPLQAGNGSLFQYQANIKTPRYALQGSYNVFVFLGEPSVEEPTAWLQDPALVGPFGVLAQDMGSMQDVIITGSIPLTRALTACVANGTLRDLTQASVTPYLKKQLQWRIAGPNGTEINPTAIPSFELSVFSSTSSHSTNLNILPTWSDLVPLHEITQGKAGGAGPSGNGGGSVGSAPIGSDVTVTVTTHVQTTVCPSATAAAYNTAAS